LRVYFTSYIDVSSPALADHKAQIATLITTTKEFIQDHTNISTESVKHEGKAQEQRLLSRPCQYAHIEEARTILTFSNTYSTM
jgi:hypothetical protein